MYGIDNDRYRNTFPEIIKKKLNSSLIQKCVDNKLQLFLVSHDFFLLEQQQKIWTNGKLIVFKNYQNFINQRPKFQSQNNKDLNQYWNSIKGSDWPESPPTTLSLLEQLPQHIQDELVHGFNNEIFRYLDFEQDFDILWHAYLEDLRKSVDLFEFDVDYAYNNSENFYKTYMQVCKYLDLPCYERIVIDKYFNMWRKVISGITRS